MSEHRATATFDLFKLTEFKKAYRRAKVNGEEIFTFENKEYPTMYAKYLIQHLELHLTKVYRKGAI